MAGEGWQSLIDLAELAVNTHLVSNQERMPYELAMAREPRLSFDVNLRAPGWSRASRLPRDSTAGPVSETSRPAIRSRTYPHTMNRPPSPYRHCEPHVHTTCHETTRIVFRPRAPHDEPRELPRPHNDYRRELPPLLGSPTRGLVYDPDGRKPRFYIALVGGVVLVLFVVQLWILRRVAALHVAPS